MHITTKTIISINICSSDMFPKLLTVKPMSHDALSPLRKPAILWHDKFTVWHVIRFFTCRPKVRRKACRRFGACSIFCGWKARFDQSEQGWRGGMKEGPDGGPIDLNVICTISDTASLSPPWGHSTGRLQTVISSLSTVASTIFFVVDAVRSDWWDQVQDQNLVSSRSDV